MKEKGREPRLPDVPLPYLVDYLFEVGPAEPGLFGLAPISHGELAAWQWNTGRRLQPWEVLMLRRLSAQWIAESQRAEAHDCPPPWVGEVVTDEEKGRVARALRDSIRRMAK